MGKEVIENFGGLYTATDDFSNPGSPDVNDWDIEINDNLVKSKGVERIEPSVTLTTLSAVTTTQAYLDVTSITIANPAQLMVGSANQFLAASSTVFIHGFNDTTYSNVIGNYYWNVSAITASAVTLEGCDTSALVTSGITAKLDPSVGRLHGFCSSGIAVDIDNVEIQGRYYDSTNNYIYGFLANTAEDKAYLAYTDTTNCDWTFAEGSAIASTTVFGTTYAAWFDKYKDEILFTKNETHSANAISITTTGGMFYIQASGQLKLYGDSNNPTGEVLEVHKDRIWIGNITKASTETQLGKSWVMVSKLYPETVDTHASIINSGIVFGTGTAKIVLSGHSYEVGDEIYLSGIVFSGVQDDMNQRLHTIVGLDGSGIVIEYNNVNDLAWDTTASAGDVLLRGATWGNALSIYDDALEGAGLFRCDDNNDDAVVQLKSAFGSLSILRERNPYIFTGAIESGSQTLARPLNVPYGTVSPHVFLSAGGVWFVSQYGISKIEGTTIKTNQNQLDNIVDITVAEPIKPTFDDIANKDNLLVYGMDRKLLIHDVDEDVTYVFDTLKVQWTRWYNRLVERYVDVGEDLFAMYKHLLFKMNSTNQVFSLPLYEATNIDSSYKTKIYDHDNPMFTKIYESLYSLIEGSATTATTNDITVNVYYNGEASPGLSFTWDIKTGTLVTWDGLTTTGTATWNSVTTTATVTWASLTGDLISMLQKRKYRLGSATQIQLEFQHNNNSTAKISRVVLDYDMLDVDTIQ